MAAAAPFLLLGAGAMQAFGQLQAGQQEQSAYNQQARNEAQQGRIAIEQANVRAAQIDKTTSNRIGAQKAAYGSSGVVANSGTPLQLMADTATKGAMARAMSQYQGKVTALSNVEQGDLDIAQGRAARQASYIGAASTILTSAAKAAMAGGNIPGAGGGG